MKKILKYSVPCAMVGAIALASCVDFLNIEPNGKILEEEMFSDVAKVSAIVDGLYDKNIQATRGGEHQRTLFGTDELRWTYNRYLNENSGLDGAFDDYTAGLDGNNANIGTPWGKYWPIVAETGKVIAGLKDNDSDEAKQLVAEARFLRGVNMFKLAVMYGDIPIIDNDFAEENGYVRQTQNVVWQFIIEDFRLAAEAFPEGASNWSRGNKYAALAMQGKSLMQAPEGVRNFATADECFTKIINSGLFDLVPNYKDLWNNLPFDHSTVPASPAVGPNVAPDFMTNGKSESLFTIAFDNREGANGGYGSCYSWWMGTSEFGNWFGGGQGPWLAGFDFMVPNLFMYEDKDSDPDYFDYENPGAGGPVKKDKGDGVWEKGDLRRDASIRYEWWHFTNMYTSQPPVTGTDNLSAYKTSDPNAEYKWINMNERKVNVQENNRDAMNPRVKKFEDARCDLYTSGNGWDIWVMHKPFPMIRYADILLLHAECMAETGNVSGGADIVQNQIRKRAWGATTPPAWNPGNADDFRRMVMDERMRELAFEGWRRADLIRTGLFVELVKERNDWTKANDGGINDTKIHWPLPIADIIENADNWGWVQNPGYRE